MMKAKLLLLVILVLALSMQACGGGGQTDPAPGSVETPLAVDPGLNLLVVADGEVLLKREGWSDYHPTAFGTVLHRGDQVRPMNEARAIVLCDGLTTWNMPAGVPSGVTNGCPPPPEPALIRNESRIGATRGANDLLIPYIISPRMTRLLTERPTLRWNEVPGASSYRVQIIALPGIDLIWEEDAAETEIVYPGIPPLEAGGTYSLVVEADTGASSEEEDTPGLEFTRLAEMEAESVRTTVKQLETVNLSDEAKAFALAYLYRKDGLIYEAIDKLEGLVERNSQDAAVYRLLGDLYQQIGLHLLAEAHYLTAIDLTHPQDAEGAAAVQASLGEVYAAIGNTTEAIDRLTQAQAKYEELGDSQHADMITERLADLTP